MPRNDEHRPLGPFDQLNRALSESMLGKEGAERVRQQAAKTRKRARIVRVVNLVVTIFFRIVWALFVLSTLSAITVALWSWAL